MWTNLGVFLVSALFGVIGFYLCLIARFYRLKFDRGPRAGWMGGALAVLLAGILFQAGVFAAFPGWLPALLICVGGLGFAGLAYRLYRVMMSV